MFKQLKGSRHIIVIINREIKSKNVELKHFYKIQKMYDVINDQHHKWRVTTLFRQNTTNVWF